MLSEMQHRDAETLSPGELAVRLGVMQSAVIRALDAGELPPGVETAWRTVGGHRKVRYRPAPPAVLVASSLFAPAELARAGFLRPWAHVARTEAVRTVADLCRATGAELVIFGGHQAELRAACRAVDFHAVEHHGIPMVTERPTWLRDVAEQWLRRQREVGYPRERWAILTDTSDAAVAVATTQLGGHHVTA